MPDGRPSWMPPLAGTEHEHLLGALNRQRVTFRWKADGLDAGQLRQRLASSDLSIGGLLHHLARVEDEIASVRLDGSTRDPYWDGRVSDDDPEFTTAADVSAVELYDRYDNAVIRANERFAAAITEDGLDHPTAMVAPGGQALSLRRLLFDVLEEYGRHTGHTDLLREAIDGRVGEDPPGSFEPFLR